MRNAGAPRASHHLVRASISLAIASSCSGVSGSPYETDFVVWADEFAVVGHPFHGYAHVLKGYAPVTSGHQFHADLFGHHQRLLLLPGDKDLPDLLTEGANASGCTERCDLLGDRPSLLYEHVDDLCENSLLAFDHRSLIAERLEVGDSGEPPRIVADLLPAVHGWLPTLRIADFEVKAWIHERSASARLADLLAKRL
jgi:hypothetical protein